MRINEYTLKHYDYEKKIIGDNVNHIFTSEKDILQYLQLPFSSNQISIIDESNKQELHSLKLSFFIGIFINY